VTIRGGRPDISDVALWLPSSSEVRNLIAEFCAVTDLYCGRAHLEERIDPARHPGEVLDLPSAAELGRTAWADVVATFRSDGNR
jgi:hypothetical protein